VDWVEWLMGGRDLEDCGSRSAWAKSWQDSITKNLNMISLVCNPSYAGDINRRITWSREEVNSIRPMDAQGKHWLIGVLIGDTSHPWLESEWRSVCFDPQMITEEMLGFGYQAMNVLELLSWLFWKACSVYSPAWDVSLRNQTHYCDSS
jgi:hypothetical protein